jgi:hypothetical protein
MFDERRNPEYSYVFRFGANKSEFITMLRTNKLRNNLANSSSTDFPVSKTDERRLLAKTSGDTSVNI